MLYLLFQNKIGKKLCKLSRCEFYIPKILTLNKFLYSLVFKHLKIQDEIF